MTFRRLFGIVLVFFAFTQVTAASDAKGTRLGELLNTREGIVLALARQNGLGRAAATTLPRHQEALANLYKGSFRRGWAIRDAVLDAYDAWVRALRAAGEALEKSGFEAEAADAVARIAEFKQASAAFDVWVRSAATEVPDPFFGDRWIKSAWAMAKLQLGQDAEALAIARDGKRTCLSSLVVGQIRLEEGRFAEARQEFLDVCPGQPRKEAFALLRVLVAEAGMRSRGEIVKPAYPQLPPAPRDFFKAKDQLLPLMREQSAAVVLPSARRIPPVPSVEVAAVYLIPADQNVLPAGPSLEASGLTMSDVNYGLQTRTAVPETPSTGPVVVVTGGLAEKDVTAILRSQINKIRHCFERVLSRAVNVHGSATFQWRVGPDGAVVDPNVVGLSLAEIDGDTRLDLLASIRKEVSGWRFPPPAGGKPTVVAARFFYGDPDPGHGAINLRLRPIVPGN